MKDSLVKPLSVVHRSDNRSLRINIIYYNSMALTYPEHTRTRIGLLNECFFGRLNN